MHLCDSHSCPEAVVIENWLYNSMKPKAHWKHSLKMSCSDVTPRVFFMFMFFFQTFPITPHRHILQNSSIMRLNMRFLCVFHHPCSCKHWPSVKVTDWDKTVQNGTLLRLSLCSSLFLLILTEYIPFCFSFQENSDPDEERGGGLWLWDPGKRDLIVSLNSFKVSEIVVNNVQPF